MFTTRLKLLACAAFAVALLMLLVLGLQPIQAGGSTCNGVNCSIIQTTTDDFVRGAFYATGLRKIGDGEVQLLPVGLTSPWQADTKTLPGARAENAVVAYGNILYTIGGYDGGAYHTQIYSATTTFAGALTSAGWQLADNLPVARAGATAVIASAQGGNILYVIGGGTGSSTDTIYYKTIGTGGNLSGSTWHTASLPTSLAYLAAVVHGNFLYVIGGDSGGSTDQIYRYPILNANGDLGSSVTDLTLPEPLSALAAVVWSGSSGDFLYVIGGWDFSATSNVYYTSFNSDGSLAGPWQTTSLVNAFSSHTAVQTRGSLVVIGGKQNTLANTAIKLVQTALIDPDGSLHNWGGTTGNWIVTEPLPSARWLHGSALDQNGEIYVVGGYDANGTATNTVYYGPTNGAGSTYAPNGQFTSDPFDMGAINSSITGLKWNGTVANANMSLQLQYRYSNDLNSLQTLPWTDAGTTPQSTTGVTVTVSIPLAPARYLQYKALFTTAISSTSPLLNAVEVDYRIPATDTPTATVTFTPSNTPTITPTGPATNTPTSTSTPKPGTPTKTPTITKTPTKTRTPTITKTPTKTRTPTPNPLAVTAQDTSPLVQYNGWRGVTNTSARGGTYRISNTPNDTVTFIFSGSSVAWITQRGPDQGIARVTIDGKLKGNIDLYEATTRWQYRTSWAKLGSGSHKLIITVTGTKNANSTDSNVTVDAFVVGKATTDDKANKVQYGGWKTVATSNAWGGTYHWSNVKGQTVSFTFTGTSVTWTTQLAAGNGQAEVYIDGVDMGKVDLYSSRAKWKTVKSYTGLTPGVHTITIKVLGTKYVKATGTKVIIDAFQSAP